MSPKKKGGADISKPKRDRKVLSLSEKVKILDLLKEGVSVAEVGRRYGKNESSIRTIRNKSREIRSCVSAAPETAKMLSFVRDKALSMTEKALNVWLEDMVSKNIPLDSMVLCEKARSLHKRFSEEIDKDDQREFKASKGWFHSFVKRYNLKNLKITGESASADAEAALKFPSELQKIIERSEYCQEQVFNCDETGLFWKKMPSRTYIHNNARQAKGFRSFKDRLTLVLCANAAGHVIKPGLIYRANNPRALKNKRKDCLPVFWQHNRKAWMTAILFQEWFTKCFVPEAKKYLEEKGLLFKVLLIVDNAPSHPESIKYENENVEVVFLPPNTTSLLQPLDQGIIKCVKAVYTRLAFTRIRTGLDADPNCNVTKLWKEFNIADAIIIISDAVDSVKPTTVNACWKPLWGEAVQDFKGFPTIETEVRNIIEIAQELGGEGLSDMQEDDVEELIESHRETLTDEDLEELVKSTEEEEQETQDDENPTDLPIWTLEKFATVFSKVQELKDLILEYDPAIEDALRYSRGITAVLQPLQDKFQTMKQERKQLPITMFLKKLPVTTTRPITDCQPSTSSAPVIFCENSPQPFISPTHSSASLPVGRPSKSRKRVLSESDSSDIDEPCAALPSD